MSHILLQYFWNGPYDSEWEDHWWSSPETWASGGTYQNATYDDYNYQYQWTRTWLGQESQVTESATNHVTGVENGTATGWWSWSYAGGSGSGSGTGSGTSSGTSSSTSWSASWSNSYDHAVTYPGFYEGAYYANGSGGYSGGKNPDEYFAYIGDAFSEASGSSSGGMLWFAYALGEDGSYSMMLAADPVNGERAFGNSSQLFNRPDDSGNSLTMAATASDDQKRLDYLLRVLQQMLLVGDALWGGGAAQLAKP